MSLSHEFSQLPSRVLAVTPGRPSTAGYSAPAGIQLAALPPLADAAISAGDRQRLYTLASACLQDPLATRQLAERVYRRLQQDLYQQRQRRGYGGQR